MMEYRRRQIHARETGDDISHAHYEKLHNEAMGKVKNYLDESTAEQEMERRDKEYMSEDGKKKMAQGGEIPSIAKRIRNKCMAEGGEVDDEHPGYGYKKGQFTSPAAEGESAARDEVYKREQDRLKRIRDKKRRIKNMDERVNPNMKPKIK